MLTWNSGCSDRGIVKVMKLIIIDILTLNWQLFSLGISVSLRLKQLGLVFLKAYEYFEGCYGASQEAALRW